MPVEIPIDTMRFVRALTRGGDMFVARVSRFDRPIGVIPRTLVFEAKANFRVVHAWLFDDHGRLLLQKIPSSKPRHPGMWGSSVAGYVQAGETYRQAIRRKLREELRLGATPLLPAGKTAMQDEGCTKFIRLFSGRLQDPARPNPSDFADSRFVTLSELVQMIRDGMMTPTFVHLLEAFPKLRPSDG